MAYLEICKGAVCGFRPTFHMYIFKKSIQRIVRLGEPKRRAPKYAPDWNEAKLVGVHCTVRQV